MAAGISRFTDEQWRTTCWHSSQDCHVWAKSAALSWTDEFTWARSVFNRLYWDPRSREPSRSRAGLTFIGLEIKRTPLSSQTCPMWTRSHIFKENQNGAELRISAILLWMQQLLSVFCCCYIPRRSVGVVRQSGGAARPQAPLRPLQLGNSDYDAPSGVFALSEVDQTAVHGHYQLTGYVETLSNDRNNS